jgi:hypothetical protein
VAEKGRPFPSRDFQSRHSKFAFLEFLFLNLDFLFLDLHFLISLLALIRFNCKHTSVAPARFILLPWPIATYHVALPGAASSLPELT